jgi:selenocysteine lyase/cysteine desulfurase
MLSCKHGKFTLPPQLAYLNCAYMAPLLKSVEKAGIRGLRKKRNPTRIMPDDFFRQSELLRQEFAKLIKVNDPKRIVIVPSVSYGMATVAKNVLLRKGENIVVAEEQFPSNFYTWKALAEEAGGQLKVVAPPQEPRHRGKRWNERILEAISASTKVVALGHVHWADGTRFQLEAIRRRASDVGAYLVIDGTQSVGALPFDVQTIRPDALICAGYKWLLGPYSIGLAYYGEAFNNGRPVEYNWINRLNSEDFTSLVAYQDEYQPGALRYEVGERSNFILVPMMLKAIEQINRWGVNQIQEYCDHISKHAIETLQNKGFWIEEAEYRGTHLFGIRLPANKDIEAIKQSLLKRKIYVSFRGNAIRVAPHVYNTEEDLLRLVNALSV